MKYETSSIARIACAAAIMVLTSCTREKPIASERVEGDISISSTTELARIADVAEIKGNLFIKRSDIVDLSLPALTDVTGRIYVQKNSDLISMSLPALRAVGSRDGDDLIIERNPALTNVSLPSLEKAASSLLVRENHLLAQINLDSLVDSGAQGIQVVNVNRIKTLTLPSLEASRNLAIKGCDWLEKLAAPRLDEIAFLSLVNNPLLHTLSFPRLIAIDTNPHVSPGKTGLLVERNNSLSTLVGLEKLETIGRNRPVRIIGNLKLHGCMANQLVTRLKKEGWKGSFEICGNLVDNCDTGPCAEKEDQANIK